MSDKPGLSDSVQLLRIDADQAGQRIDNYLIARLKGVPRSRIYRLLRKGEVRVNKGRINGVRQIVLQQPKDVRVLIADNVCTNATCQHGDINPKNDPLVMTRFIESAQTDLDAIHRWSYEF